MAGLYIHIPFCASKCIYCDFYSMAGHSRSIEAYVDALLGEAVARRSEIAEPMVTIYIGGGTPSLLSAGQMGRLIAGLRRVIDLSQVQEFTVEVNPDDVTQPYIEALVELGVNRVSMGIQSFSDADLRLIGRRHTAQQAIEAVHAIKRAGVGNISIDLIYGLPGQTIDTWQRNVEQAIGLGVQHISAYSLMWEPGTRLWVMKQQGRLHEVSDEASVAMELLLAERLRAAGFEHYEISNFGLPGYHSVHNSNYWNLTPYLGLGAAAHSYDGTVRRHNPANLKQYLANPAASFEAEEEEDWERYDEYVMLRLRTAEGIDVTQLQSRFPQKFVRHFQREAQALLQSGQLVQSGTHYRIPENQIMFTDAITRAVMWDE